MALRKEDFVYRDPEAKQALIIELADPPPGLKRLPMTKEAFDAILKVPSPYTYLFVDGMVYETGWTPLPEDPEIQELDGIPMTEEAFEALLYAEEITPYHYEMADGVVYNMGDPQLKHSDVAINIVMDFKRQIGKRGPCHVYTEQSVAVPKKPIPRPDVILSCNPEDRERKKWPWIHHPRIIVEVLSRSSHKFDCGAKFRRYKDIPSLEVYILAAQDKPVIELYRRSTNWEIEQYTNGQTIRVLGEPLITLDMDELYDGVWEPE
jgi:Uma2 family endonuclease